MSSANYSLRHLPSEDWIKVHGVVARFEDAWQAGPPPSIDDYLRDAETVREVVLLELVHVDLEYRLKANEAIRVEHYLERYPRLTAHPLHVCELIATEYRLRRRRESALSPDDVLSRFPQYAEELAPRLAQAVEVSHDSVSRPSTIHERRQVPSLLRRCAAVGPLQVSACEILGELGRGGMGIVYRAHDRKRDAIVALKTLAWVDPGALYRFKQEFRALADVTHRNLVALYELVAEGETWFFTMEYVDGVDFRSHVRPGEGPVHLERLRDALRQLANGLDALHMAGKLHRDVKPSNVLVSRKGRLVILDFGLATELDRSGEHRSATQGTVGTVAYMAPEQGAGLPVTPASDWYSVGVMLYEAITGQLPFRGDAIRLLEDKRQRDPRPPRELAPDLPADLGALCTELLSRDPTARPSGAEVLRRLGGPAIPMDVPRPRSATLFVGRQQHLDVLRDSYQAMTEGRTVCCHIQGRSGAGKTALVQRFLDELSERDAVILAGRCYEHESVPYKALDSLVDALSRYLSDLPSAEVQALLPRDVQALARLFPVLRRIEAVARAPVRSVEAPNPQEVRRRASAAFRELLGRLGDRQPLVLFIDDLQWGDIDSTTLIADLLRPPDAPVLLLLASYRSHEAAGSPFLQAFLKSQEELRPAERRDVTVEALTPAEARDLALALLGRADEEAREHGEAIARESGGNAFFVYELVQHLQAGEVVSGGGVTPRVVTLDGAIWDRVCRLPEEARRLLEVIAIAGRPLRQSDASRATGSVADPRAALAVLRSGRLVSSRGPVEREEVESYHDRVRETVAGQLTPEVRTDCHRRLAHALEADGHTDPEVLAVHFEGAGEPLHASRYFAQAAGQAAEALAFDHAAELYRRALKLAPGDAIEERPLRVKLGDALANAGRGADAAHEYLTAAARSGASEALELRRRAALQFLGSGHVDEGLQTLRNVLGPVGLKLPATPRRALLSLLLQRARLWLRGLRFRERKESEIPAADLTRIDVCWSVSIGLGVIDNIRGAEIQTRHLLLALDAGEPFRIARALAVEAPHTGAPGGRSWQRASRLVHAADVLAEHLQHPYALGIVALSKGITAYTAQRWKEGQHFCDRAEAIFRDRCTGVAWELATAHTFALWCLGYLGELAELSRRCPALVQEAQERGDLYALTNIQTFTLPLTRLAADDPESARRDVKQALSQWSQQGYHIQHYAALVAGASIDLYTGDAASAWERGDRETAAFTRSLLPRVQVFRTHVQQMHAYSALARLAAAVDPRPLLRAVQRGARRLRRERMPWSDATAVYLQGVLAANRGDGNDAHRLLTNATAQFEAIDMRLHAAAVRRRLGELLGGGEGRDLIAVADAFMAAQNVRDPSRMAAVYAPGFRPR
ncbi:MAG: protein kinase [Gemmataceae bacterium]|nr:protein kinase [Gemmataceae bacterium]